MGGLLGEGGGGQRVCWPPLKLLGRGALPPSSYAYGKSERVMIITKQAHNVSNGNNVCPVGSTGLIVMSFTPLFTF